MLSDYPQPVQDYVKEYLSYIDTDGIFREGPQCLLRPATTAEMLEFEAMVCNKVLEGYLGGRDEGEYLTIEESLNILNDFQQRMLLHDLEKDGYVVTFDDGLTYHKTAKFEELKPKE